MNALVRHLFCSGILVGVLGCTLFIPKETLYLKSAQGRATQEEVQQQLGTPVLTSSTAAGEPIWVYHVPEQEPGSQNTWATAGSWCDEYVLTFDTQGILRHWTNKSERHGGETVPQGPCVSDGFQSAKLPPSPYTLEQFK